MVYPHWMDHDPLLNLRGRRHTWASYIFPDGSVTPPRSSAVPCIHSYAAANHRGKYRGSYNMTYSGS